MYDIPSFNHTFRLIEYVSPHSILSGIGHICSAMKNEKKKKMIENKRNSGM